MRSINTRKQEATPLTSATPTSPPLDVQTHFILLLVENSKKKNQSLEIGTLFAFISHLLQLVRLHRVGSAVHGTLLHVPRHISANDRSPDILLPSMMIAASQRSLKNPVGERRHHQRSFVILSNRVAEKYRRVDLHFRVFSRRQSLVFQTCQTYNKVCRISRL